MKTSKIQSFLTNTHLGTFIGICFIIHFLINLPFFWLPEESLKNDNVEMIKQTSGKAGLLFATVILAPIFETFLYQFSVIKLLRLVIKKTILCFCIAVPVSAFIFSLDHTYSIYYQIGTFFIGLLYATVFFIGQYRRDLPAFLIVAILHGSWNLFAFIMDEIGY